MTRRSDILMAGAIFILMAQAISSYALHREPFLPSPPSLVSFPLRLGNWTQVQDGTVEPDVRDLLGADDLLVRQYQPSVGPAQAEVFVAYYKTQLRNKNVHDPKVCLPGAGWNAKASRVAEITPAGSKPFLANYYRIAKGENEAVVVYWFQTYNGVYIFEQQLRFHRMLDTIFDNRTDMALVRIVVPIAGSGIAAADAAAMQLAPLCYRQMLQYFPLKESSAQ
jgi:EpsI family protein